MWTLRKRLKYWLHSWVPGFTGRFRYYGTTVHFPPGAMVFRVTCEQGRFEPEIVDRLVRLVRPGTTVMDVGANIGLMAIPVLRTCSTCQVVSFEPSPNSLPLLERTAREGEFRDRWTIVGVGLSNLAGELDFSIGRPTDALFEGFRSGERLPGGSSIRVPVSTLDLEWQRLGRPEVSVVKLDVEGAEGLVLGGASAVVQKCRPAILIEWHEPYLRSFDTPTTQLIAFAEQYGYRIFTVPAGVPVDDARTLRVQMIDCQNFLLLP